MYPNLGSVTTFFFVLLLSTPALARNSHRLLDPVLYKHRRVSNALNPNTTLRRTGSQHVELEKRDGQKYVFMHHIVGNTYPYTQTDWENDIQQVQAKGIDAFALNMGGDDWQRSQVASAYAAAENLGTNFKLFISFDLSAMDCNVNNLIDRVNEFRSHPNQFRFNNQPLVSSFEGNCLGNIGWLLLKEQTGAYLMPFIEGIEGLFNIWSFLDSWFCWGCAWPSNDADKGTDDDHYYIGQLGTRYATTVSAWMFSHYGYKNWYRRGDDWLLNTRWEQLMTMRDTLTFVEMVSWNDYGESHYVGTIKGAQPDQTTWVNNFPHTAWFDMSEYYITAFKTGSYPAVTEDIIYYWARPHPAVTSASSDPLPLPDGYNWASDNLYAVVFATAPCTVILTCGSSTQTFDDVGTGVTKLKIPLAAGTITVTMVRDGVTIINQTPPASDYTFITNPTLYNYNAYVGSAKSVTTPTTPTNSATSTIDPVTTSTDPATTSTAATLSSTTTTMSSSSASPTATWAYLGCYPDYDPGRTLNNGVHNSIPDQTVAACLSMCATAGYAFGGTEYGVECWCSSIITDGITPAAESDCNMSCSGKSDDICGGGNRISLYSSSVNPSSTTPTSTTPLSSSSITATTSSSSSSPTATSISDPTWTYLGCYPDYDPRTLNNGIMNSIPDQTVATCLSMCGAAGYAFGGTEYGVECWCSSTITDGITPAAGSDCNMPCSGKSDDVCGGGNRISLYSANTNPSSTTSTSTTSISTTSTTSTTTSTSTTSTPSPTQTGSYYGCVAEGTTGSRRSLVEQSYTQSDMTPQLCQSLCSNYQYAGVEYGAECYCGNSLVNNGGTGSLIDPNNCNVPCGGDPSQICGGSWTLSVYSQGPVPSSSAPPSSSGWSNAGCFIDFTERILRFSMTSEAGMTTERCIDICTSQEQSIAATEYGTQCLCGSQLFTTLDAGILTSASDCNMPCGGNPAQTCGSGWRANVYMKPGTQSNI